MSLTITDLDQIRNVVHDEVDYRFTGIEQQLEGIGQHFTDIEVRFDGLEKEVSDVGTQLQQINTRLSRLETEVQRLNEYFKGEEGKIAAHEDDIREIYKLLQKAEKQSKPFSKLTTTEQISDLYKRLIKIAHDTGTTL